MPQPACIDCIAEGITAYRPPHVDSGPRTRRCTTHHRARKKTSRLRAHERHIGSVYGITAHQYALIKDFQGGKCAICRKSTGASKSLAVDHDHKTGEVRGCCCGPCNYNLLGKYDVDSLIRAIAYLYDPPARKALGLSIFVPLKDAVGNENT